MAPYVEYELENGGTVRIQTNAGGGDDQRLELQSVQSLEDALAGVQQTAGQMIRTFKEMNIDEMELSFGLIANGDDGSLQVCRKCSESNFEVKLRWRSSHRIAGPGIM
ncbi:MAG: hypothetical protein K8R77_04865 [Anaerolineaceae bacterium]|nr:hypothetical protein [Anaerolineaceae bacterium]